MQGLDQAIETVAPMAGAALSASLAYMSVALFAIVLVGFYAWFVPKRADEAPAHRPENPIRHAVVGDSDARAK